MRNRYTGASFVVDLEAVEQNIATLMKRFQRFPAVSVRPHQKTAENAEFAKMMLERELGHLCGEIERSRSFC